MKLRDLVLVIALSLVAGQGHAAIKQWTFQNAVFECASCVGADEPGTITGYFNVDTDTGLLDSFEVRTTDETIGFSGREYSSADSTVAGTVVSINPGGDTLLELTADDTVVLYESQLRLWFDGDVFADTGTLPIFTRTDGSSTFPSAELEGENVRYVEGGAISAVPLPAAAWLFGSGLLGLIGVANRRQSKA